MSTTPRRLLALAAAIGTVTGAIAGVLALLPKPPPALTATFESITANPEVSLEQYDARAGTGIVVARRTASVAGFEYRLAADTTMLATTGTSTSEESANTGSTSTTTRTTTERRPDESTHTQTSTTATTRPTTSTAATPTTTSATETSRSGRRVTRKGAKRRGGRITLTPAATSYPEEKPEQQVRPQTVAAPPAQSLHPVEGALVSEGAGVPPKKVAAVFGLLGATPAEPARETSPSGETATPTSGAAPSPEATTDSATTPTSEAAPTQASQTQAEHVVVPAHCSTHACGVTQEVEKALTYDPNPVKAAEAVAALFVGSRAEVVGKDLYPLGAEVTFNANLKGFANRDLTLEWSLIGKASRRPLARPWWRNIVVAHIKPTIDEESFGGSFWVPEPPERGDYLVHLVLLDDNRVEHAASDSSPAFH